MVSIVNGPNMRTIDTIGSEIIDMYFHRNKIYRRSSGGA